MQNIVLFTKNLTKTYGRQNAVEDLSMQVPAGAIYGLLGPNGAGKTTTLKLLTGLLRPTRGEIWMDGHLWQRSDLGQMGALIESPALYGNLTAVENLRVHTLLMGLPESRIHEVLAVAGLSSTGKKLIGQFSLGMKQRLGIALALLGHPRLLILDEPTNGLDPLGIQELRELVRLFPTLGITVILSSHILSEVEQLATHVGIISGGKLLYEQACHSDEDLEELFMQVIGAHQTNTVVEVHHA